MMTKFKAVVEYDGTAYHGWQLQTALPTIQGAMENALARILGTLTRVHGAGRTDAGVHATGQVAHFSSEWNRSAAELHKACNALLPPDVMIRDLTVVPEGFHARHSARSKTYVFSILNHPLRSPLNRSYFWHVPYPLDLNSMQEAAACLNGTHDFAAFGSPTDGTTSTVRQVLSAGWHAADTSFKQSPGETLSSQEVLPVPSPRNAMSCSELGFAVSESQFRGGYRVFGEGCGEDLFAKRSSPQSGPALLCFTIRGTGFLRYMVRSIVGTLVLVGRGKIIPSDFAEILVSCDRSKSGPTAPPHGLCLQFVEY